MGPSKLHKGAAFIMVEGIRAFRKWENGWAMKRVAGTNRVLSHFIYYIQKQRYNYEPVSQSVLQFNQSVRHSLTN